MKWRSTAASGAARADARDHVQSGRWMTSLQGRHLCRKEKFPPAIQQRLAHCIENSPWVPVAAADPIVARLWVVSKYIVSSVQRRAQLSGSKG